MKQEQLFEMPSKRYIPIPPFQCNVIIPRELNFLVVLTDGRNRKIFRSIDNQGNIHLLLDEMEKKYKKNIKK